MTLMTERTCARCGGENASWFVDSDRWNIAFPAEERDIVACPGCFVAAHEKATGMSCTWQLIPSTPFRWLKDLED